MLIDNYLLPRARVGELWEGFLALVYPPYCPICRNLIEQPPQPEGPICTACLRRIERLALFCGRCGAPLSAPNQPCGACLGRTFPFHSARALAQFDDHLQALIHQFKYRGRRSIGRQLGRLMAYTLQDDPRFTRADLLIPVPLHKVRQRERGFNQSMILAETLAMIWGCALGRGVLTRIRATPSQTGLNGVARQANVADAFAVTQAGQITGKRVVLVDDVFTTGATAGSCASALKTAGASTVYILTLAHA